MKNNESGFLLLELLISSLVGILAFFALQGIAKFATLSFVATDLSGERNRMLESLVLDIGQMGISAGDHTGSQCSSAQPSTLECWVIRTHDNPTLVLTRYTLQGSDVLMQTKDEAGEWRTHVKYPKIRTFEICDFTKMTGGTCPIPNTLLSTKAVLTNGGTPAGRFFRYLVEDEVGGVLQGAFYVRNPSSFQNIVFMALPGAP